MIDKYVVYRGDTAFYVVRKPRCPFCDGRVVNRWSKDIGDHFVCRDCLAISISWEGQKEWSNRELRKVAKCEKRCEAEEELQAQLEEQRGKEKRQQEAAAEDGKRCRKREHEAIRRRREREEWRHETGEYGHLRYYLQGNYCGFGPSWLAQPIVCHVDVERLYVPEREEGELDPDVIIAYQELAKANRAALALNRH